MKTRAEIQLERKAVEKVLTTGTVTYTELRRGYVMGALHVLEWLLNEGTPLSTFLFEDKAKR